VQKKRLPKHGCLIEKLERAELIRDKIAHGMPWKEADARIGLVDLCDFAREFNDFVDDRAGILLFGDFRGSKRKEEPLTNKSAPLDSAWHGDSGARVTITLPATPIDLRNYAGSRRLFI